MIFADEPQLLRLLVCFGLSYPLSFLNLFLYPQEEQKKDRSTQKHVYCASVGAAMAYYVFGWVALVHVLLTVAYTKIALATINPKSRQLPVTLFIISMVHVSYCHLQRLWYAPESSVDVTGIMMVIVIKVTSLAWQRYDQKFKQVSFLECTGFLFFFPTIMAGPSMDYTTYVDYVENKDNVTITVKETWKPACYKLIQALFFAILHLSFSYYVPPSEYFGWRFSWNPLTLIQRLVFNYLCLQGFKAKFYFVWIISEGACIAIGHGRTQDGQWNGMSNVDPWAIETATNFQTINRQWNKRTHHWLKNCVFIRIIQAFQVKPLAQEVLKKEVKVGEAEVAVSPKVKSDPRLFTIATYAVYFISALWHGFYSGYYLTFLSGALVTNVERKVKFQGLVGWLFAQVALSYCTIPFIVLYLVPSIKVWMSVGFCFHFVLLALNLQKLGKDASKNTSTVKQE